MSGKYDFEIGVAVGMLLMFLLCLGLGLAFIP